MNRALSPSGHGNPRRASRLTLLLALTLVSVYVVFAGLAYRHYPDTFSPFHNDTLSQLGNPTLNPHGAVLYNLGSSLCGVVAILLFLSLARWVPREAGLQVALMRLLQALGIAAGFGMIMLAVFPENLESVHRAWAGVVFLGFGSAIFLSPAALRRAGRPVRPLLYLALATVLVDAASQIFYEAHWIEWLTVGLFMSYMIMLGVYGWYHAGGTGQGKASNPL